MILVFDDVASDRGGIFVCSFRYNPSTKLKENDDPMLQRSLRSIQECLQKFQPTSMLIKHSWFMSTLLQIFQMKVNKNEEVGERGGWGERNQNAERLSMQASKWVNESERERESFPLFGMFHYVSCFVTSSFRFGKHWEVSSEPNALEIQFAKRERRAEGEGEMQKQTL